MHETRFVNEIIFVIKHKLEPEMLKKQLVINVRLSPLSHVTSEGLKETFKTLIQNEQFSKNVELNISLMEFDVYCKTCKKISKVKGPVFNCPRCNSTDLDIQQEREFIIDSVEIR